MDQRAPAGPSDAQTVALVRKWVAEAAALPVDRRAQRLAGLLQDSRGLAFTVGFADGVIRPDDVHVSADNLAALAVDVPRFLPLPLRCLVRLGGAVGPRVPWLVIPIARLALRRMVGHLLLDADDRRLERSITRLHGQGMQLNLNLLGEAVLGNAEATRRLKGTCALLARADVDYVSLKVSSATAPHNPWGFDAAVLDIADRLRPLYALAARTQPHKFVNLDMEEYHDLDLTIAVFTELLDRPELRGLEAGIVLQAYLPDAMGAMVRLQDWAAGRRTRGGAGIKVRLVKGANLPMERVESNLRDWPLATWQTKRETDANYKRLLDFALTPERVANVRIGVASHNLFDVAHAWLLAGERGVRDGMDVEMLLGMAPNHARVVRRAVGCLRLYTPVVRREEFDAAVAYLVRRLQEGASEENFLSALFSLESDESLFTREHGRFTAALRDAAPGVPLPHRTADRYQASGPPGAGRFANTPDSDPAVPGVRGTMTAALARARESVLGIAVRDAATVDDEAGLEAVLECAGAAGRAWGALRGQERCAVLHAVGDALELRRWDLIEVMAAETGKTGDQGDPEVSEAVDFAHYYAELAAELDDIDGARLRPARVTLVTPPWNFPVSIPAGSALGALAAGSAVVLKPAPEAERCAAVLVSTIRDALSAAGVSPDVLRLLVIDERAAGAALIAHPAVDRVILTGAFETAELFRTFRRDLPLLAETSGKNAIVVTPSADVDLAVKDIVASAFGHAGQKCSAASLVVLVGSVARSERFLTKLADAASSLVVGPADDPATQLGPVIATPAGKLRRALTTLDEGERWLLAPRSLDATGRLWSPGIKTGVRRGSWFHRTECFGPVLGVLTAATLDAAIEIVNDVDFGLTSGLHSLDPDELAAWESGVEAGNLYVNRGITGAVVRRQPFGGWKKSSVGPGTKAGGPSYLIGLGDWETAPSCSPTRVFAPQVRGLLEAARSVLDAADVAMLERAAGSDADAWTGTFAARDVSALWAERNVLRHVPTPVTVRLPEGAPAAALVRVVAAGALAGSPLTVSVPASLAGALRASVGAVADVVVQSDAEWLAYASASAPARVRLVGGSARALYEATSGRPDVSVWSGAVTEAGRIELLAFVREQAISVTAHRFGSPAAAAPEHYESASRSIR
ncbi:MAG: Aldehyde Dehydrogenase [Frankiales bacterium]|nr:Aldehyde Dehydrogenase [Frankiales bacterium]